MFYAVLYSCFPIFSLYSASSDLYLSLWKNVHSLVLVSISGVFIVFFAILTMFLISNLTRVFRNDTAQEIAENDNDRKYSIGFYRNFVQVFGKKPIMWLVPYSGIYAPLVGNGIDWRMGENLSKPSLDKKND
jgi:high-affinity nickel permease